MHPAKLALAALPLAALVLGAPASATTAPSCHASMSSSRPADYTTTDVIVKTAPGVKVTTVAYYKTTITMHTATAPSSGRALVPYRISRATPGFKVRVGTLVVSGARTASCLASFIPHA